MIKATDMRCISPQFRKIKGLEACVRKLSKKIELGEKYANVPPVEIHRAQKFIGEIKKILSQLDNNKKIEPNPEIRQLLALPRKELYRQLMPSSPDGKLTQYTTLEIGVLKSMTEKAALSNAQRNSFILQLEVAMAAHKGWYMIFNTLTARDDTLHEVFTKDSNAFKMYIRRFKRTDPDHRYFAVMEFGGKGGRPHLHVLHFMRRMPWRDPNRSGPVRHRRQIEEIRGFWGHGFSTPIAVRYFNDAYNKLGWLWPTDKLGTPIKASQPGATASYITKYVTKSYETERNEFPWRIRKSRGFGNQILRPILEKMTDDQLVAAILYENKIKLGMRTLPLSLLHREAMKTLIERWSLEGSLSQMIKDWQSQATLFMRLRHSTQMTQTSNSQNIMSFMIKNSLVTDRFNPLTDGRSMRALIQDELSPLFSLTEREQTIGHSFADPRTSAA